MRALWLVPSSVRSRRTCVEAMPVCLPPQADPIIDRNRTVQRNLGLARSVALKYYRPPEPELSELVNVAVLAMIHAVELYDPDLGTFSSYAWRWMESEVCRYVRRAHRHVTICPSRTPRHLERELSRHDLTRAQRLSAELALAAQAPAVDADAVSLACDCPSVDDCVDEHERLCRLRVAISRLPSRDQLVIRMRLEEASLEEIGVALGIARSRVQQIEAEARERIRREML